MKPLGGDYARNHLMRCRNCGFVFTAIEPDDQELMDHYAGYVREYPLSWVTEKRYGEILDSFEPFRKTGRIFDIGCGSGYFLKVARDRGWEPYGLEFDEAALKSCREKGVQIFEHDADPRHLHATFDVVTAFEVLEHLKVPGDTVRFAHALLRQGGAFYFTTPNFGSLSRRILGGKWPIVNYPEHLCYYTPATVNRLITQAGFEKRWLRTDGISVNYNLLAFRRNKVSANEALAVEESLRETMERRKLLGFAKKMVNSGLALTGSGDTIKGLYVKT